MPDHPPRLTRADFFAAFVLTGIAAAFFWRFVFTDLILPRGDVFTYFTPYWHYRNEALLAGRIPFWNPILFMGVPFLANSQAGVLYPPNWLFTALDAPTAIKYSIILHIVWAVLGTYLFARRTLRISILSASLTAITFALGGYLTAQVEHVNQVQGLAWMPFLFWLWDEARSKPRYTLWLALALSMQLLAGHTQSAFISGFGLGIWALWHGLIGYRAATLRRSFAPFGLLAGASLLAIALAAIQLLPTAELARLSNRNSGLPLTDAVSFSLRPELLARGLLPAYGETSLFSEYIAYAGIVTMILAVIGLWLAPSNGQRLGLVILAILGLCFGLGRYNPLYWALVYVVPGFSLFRAPARWLLLSAFSLSSLAGIGLDSIAASLPSRRANRSLIAAGIAIILLMALSPLAILTRDPLLGATPPSLAESAIWIATLSIALALLRWLITASPRAFTIMPPAIVTLATIELFLASRSLPFNNLSSPAAWSSQRPAISTLLAAQSGEIAPPRILSLSDIRFDPGDLREIESIYGTRLTEAALYDYIIAVKQKEILSPNLPMAWGIASMDGFDGGILPTRAYIRYTSLFLPADSTAVDGRLREYLHAVPADQWLDIADVGYVITDKVYDLWHEGIYYDLQFPEQPPTAIEPSQPFEATAIGLIGHLDEASDIAPNTEIGTITIVADNGASSSIPIQSADFDTTVGSFTYESPETIEYLALKTFDVPTSPTRIEITLLPDRALVIRGATLIDQRTGAFLPLSLSPDRRIINSGDVKVYEVSTRSQRASIVCNPEIVDSDELMWERMESGKIPVILDSSPATTCDSAERATADMTLYNPERIEIEIKNAPEGAYLILSDAYYPGWHATVGGEPATILPANGMFRAIRLNEGSYTVSFTFRSRSFEIGAGITTLALIATFIGLIFTHLRKRIQ